MIPDGPPGSTLEPAASLTSVRVKRRKPPVAPTGKPGDLTAGGGTRPEPEPAADHIIVLPPPAALELPDPALPLAEVLLPELVAEPAPEPAEPEFDAEPEPEWQAPVLLLLPPAPEPEPVLAAPPAAMPEPVPEPPPVAPDAGDVGPDLLDYWDTLRGARDFPALDALDRGHVASRWANTLLVAVDPTELQRITRLGEHNGEIEYTATVIDWIVTRSRNAARRGEPMEEEQRFAVSSGGARYRLLLLPLGDDGPKAHHVLCQLSRLEELSAVASFRRWLTG